MLQLKLKTFHFKIKMPFFITEFGQLGLKNPRAKPVEGRLKLV